MSQELPGRRLRRRVELAVVLTALGAVASSGAAGVVIAALGALGVILGHLRSGRPGPAELGRWRLANAVALVSCVLLGALSVNLLAVGLGLVTWLQVHRAWTGGSPGDGRVAQLLALLHVLLSCILSISGWLAPVFVFFVGLVPIHLLLIHIEQASPPGTLRSQRRLGALWGLAPVVLAGTVALFYAIPRLDAGGVGGVDQSLVGFDRDMELGDLGSLKGNPEIMLRVRVEDSRGALRKEPRYFRGSALDHFDGARWRATLDGRVEAGWFPDEPGAGVEVLVQEVLQKRVEGGVLFGAPQIHSVTGTVQRPKLDLNGTWRLDGDDETVRTLVRSVVRSRGVPLPETPAARQRAAGYRAEQAVLRSGALTSLPPGLDPRIAELAEQWAQDADDETNLGRATALETALRRELEYTLLPAEADAGQHLSTFLFESRRGHCEYFATALAVMLRSQGIPARVVTGFYGGEWNVFGEYLVVRQGDAHAWVEAWFPDAGWVLMDATPAAEAPPPVSALAALVDVASERWQRTVLDFDLQDQLRAVFGAFGGLQGGGGLGSSGSALSAVLAVVALIVASQLFRQLTAVLAGERRSRPRRSAVWRLHGRARRVVARRGWQLPAGLPPVRAAEWLVERVGDRAEPLLELAWCAYRAEYGGGGAEELAQARAALRTLRRSLPRRHRD